MAQISVKVTNKMSDDQNVHVFDNFAGGRREVLGSPFALAVHESNAAFGVKAAPST